MHVTFHTFGLRNVERVLHITPDEAGELMTKLHGDARGGAGWEAGVELRSDGVRCSRTFHRAKDVDPAGVSLTTREAKKRRRSSSRGRSTSRSSTERSSTSSRSRRRSRSSSTRSRSTNSRARSSNRNRSSSTSSTNSRSNRRSTRSSSSTRRGRSAPPASRSTPPATRSSSRNSSRSNSPARRTRSSTSDDDDKQQRPAAKIKLSELQYGIVNLADLEAEPDLLAGLRYETHDPGDRWLFSGHHGTIITAASYHALARTAAHTRATNDRNDRVADELADLAKHSSKTADATKLKTSLHVLAKHWTSLWATLGQRWYRRQRFQAKIDRQRATDRVVNELYKDVDILVVGECADRTGFHGRVAAPVTAIRNHAARRHPVVLVPEEGSTVICAEPGCHARMTASRKCGKTFYCPGHRKAVHRDRNAPINLDLAFVAHMRGEPRPVQLRPDRTGRYAGLPLPERKSTCTGMMDR